MKNLKFSAQTAVFTALSVVLMSVSGFPLPFLPPFLNIDLSNIPVMIVSISSGTLTGILSLLVKDIFALTFTKTGGIGELADFLCSAALILPFSLLKKTRNTLKHTIFISVSAILAMSVVGIVTNKLFLLPFYSKLVPLNSLFELCRKINPLITDEFTYLLYGVLPFNLIKGIILSILTIAIYKRISRLLRR